MLHYFDHITPSFACYCIKTNIIGSRPCFELVWIFYLLLTSCWDLEGEIWKDNANIANKKLDLSTEVLLCSQHLLKCVEAHS